MNTQLVVALLAGAVSLAAAGLAAWTTLRVKRIEAERAEEQRRHEAERETSRFHEPLARAAYDLQSRLYNIVEQDFLEAFLVCGRPRDRDYAIRNTAFVVAQFFGWSELARRELRFVDLGRADRTRCFFDRQEAVQRAWSSDRADAGTARLRIFAGEQRAIGEAMIVADGARLDCRGYGAFLRDVVGSGDQLIHALLTDVEALPGELAQARPRLVNVQHALLDLLDMLDPKFVRFPKKRRSRMLR